MKLIIPSSIFYHPRNLLEKVSQRLNFMFCEILMILHTIKKNDIVNYYA